MRSNDEHDVFIKSFSFPYAPFGLINDRRHEGKLKHVDMSQKTDVLTLRTTLSICNENCIQLGTGND